MKLARMIGAAAVLSSAFAAPLRATDAIPWPELAVPRMAAPPVIDGAVGEDEWATASSITGVATWAAEGAPGQPPAMVPEIQQVRWFIGYDDANLYLAMYSPHPKGSALTANVKKNDEGYTILWDDHTEIQLSPRGRSIPDGFYKIMVNPRGFLADQWWFSGTPGAEDLWQSGATVRSSVRETAWQVEMAIPFKTMDTAGKPDGARWVVNLVRTDFCGGVYFAGWVGSSWMGWKEFPEIVFSPEAPSFHLRRIGDVPAGKLDAEIVLSTRRERETVEAAVRVTDADGREIYRDAKTVVLSRGTPASLRFARDGLELSPEKDAKGAYLVNRVEITAVSREDANAGRPETPVYRASIPVIRMTDRYWNQCIKPWQERRQTAGDYSFTFAHYPSIDSFEAWVDLDLFGVPKEIRTAKRCRFLVLDATGKERLRTEAAVGADLQGHAIAKIPTLGEGRYRAVVRLLDERGRQVSEKSAEFVRERWPWEGNTLGMEDVVIPPFIPVAAKDRDISVWNRSYRVGAAGLPEKILVGGGEKKPGSGPDILGGVPMTLRLTAEGKTHTLAAAEAGPVAVRPTTATTRAGGVLGPIKVSTDVSVEYDGWYLVSMTLTPERPVPVDELAMRWTVPGADTLVVMRGDVVEQGYFGAFPPGDGVVWDSTRLNPAAGLLGTWAPACFIGTGDGGVWYFGESDEGWVLDDKAPAIAAERVGGAPVLSFRFVNRKTVLDKPRRIVFALQATPVKPLPAGWRKTAWGVPGGLEYVHDTRGYRMYGASVDGFELYTENDYRRLRDTYLGLLPAPAGSHGCRPLLAAQRPLVLYGSGRMTGISREFATFAGEWMGRTNYRGLLKPENSFKGKASDGGIVWNSEDDVSPSGVFHTPSFIDYHVWYHRNLAEKAFVNGTWWDNGSLDYGGPAALGCSYVRDDGSVQGKSNLFAWRAQTKRLNTMHWQVGRPPLYVSNMHPLCSFTQIGWHIENSFHRFQGNTYVERLGENTGVDVFRALIGGKQGIVSRFAYGGRVGWAMSLLHDIGNTSPPEWRADEYPAFRKFMDTLEEHVSFFSGRPRFIPYWRNKAAAVTTPDVWVSAYVHDPLQPWEGNNPPKPPRAALVVFNGGDERVIEGFAVDPKPFGLQRVSRITDAETGIPLPLVYTPKTGYAFGEVYQRPGTLRMRKHDFRVLIVE